MLKSPAPEKAWGWLWGGGARMATLLVCGPGGEASKAVRDCRYRMCSVSRFQPAPEPPGALAPGLSWLSLVSSQ